MATVKDLLARKGNANIWSVGKEATVLQAAQLMNEHKIGALVVLENDALIGIFTERDVLKRVVVEQRPPATTHVKEVMTTGLACCKLDTPLEEARSAMKNRRIRHLPVIDEEGRMRGLISIGDVNAFDAAEQEHTIFLMNEYLSGAVR
jgi:CBS domain-containing protein